MAKFSVILKTLRKEHDFTQQELADKSGISRSNINNWENDKSLPLPNGLIALADAFGCSVDYLLGRESEEGIIVVSGDFTLSETEKTLIKDFRMLPSRQQSLISGLVHGMVS